MQQRCLLTPGAVRSWLAVVILLLSYEVAWCQEYPPNVLFILADDLGVNALGCYGNEWVETPNLDRLAARGVRFSNGYSSDPTCAPSRASIMTGQYVPRHRIYRVADRFTKQPGWLKAMRYLPPANLRPNGRGVGIDPDQITLAEAFQAAGYRTGGFGKWHLGRGESGMGQQGFGEARETTGHYDFKVHEGRDDRLPGEYNAHFTTRLGVDFMRRSVAAGQPFFLFLPYYLVHKPLEPEPAKLRHFQRLYGEQLAPETINVLAMIGSLDDYVGQVLSALDELEIADQTVVAFVSDNGHYRTDDDIFNTPYRGHKGETLEGGIRVPYIFRWPGRIEPGTVDEPALHIDLYPTLLGLAGKAAPAAQLLDGEDLSPLLLGERDSTHREQLVWQYTNYGGYNARTESFRSSWVNVIQRNGWKLTEDVETDTYTLFDLRNDPYETRDLADQYPKRVNEMREHLEQWKQRTGAVDPRPNPDYLGH